MDRNDCTCKVKTARKGWKCPVCGKVVSGPTMEDTRNEIEREIIDTTEVNYNES